MLSWNNTGNVFALLTYDAYMAFICLLKFYTPKKRRLVTEFLFIGESGGDCGHYNWAVFCWKRKKIGGV